MKTHNIILIIIITSLAAILVYKANSAEPLTNPKFFDFPLTIDNWHGKDIPMGDYVYKGIETPYLFLRDYYSPKHSTPVNLSIVWFDDTNIAFHTPEACLGGVGDRVLEDSTINVNLGGKEYRLGKFITTLGGARNLVLYYFDVDGYITTSQVNIRLKVLLNRLAFKRPSASFVRIMAPIKEDEAHAMNICLKFLRGIFPLIPQYTYTKSLANEHR